MCGNYFLGAMAAAEVVGSPPRVRELLQVPSGAAMMVRITPACAGITSCTCSTAR